eukprot:240834-Pelagomonas_calceolata.AAC.1
MKQISKGPKRSASDITVEAPCQSHPNLQLRIADWRYLACTDGSCQVQNGQIVLGAGVYHPMSDSQNLVEPNGADIINTIGRAELADIAAALTHGYTHIATDSLSSLLQLRKQILYPEKHGHH